LIVHFASLKDYLSHLGLVLEIKRLEELLLLIKPVLGCSDRAPDLSMCLEIKSSLRGVDMFLIIGKQSLGEYMRVLEDSKNT
jgi:hypothetical protein